MLWRIVKRVFKIAVAQPWEYVGEGAPTDWELRISPDEKVLALYNPYKGPSGRWYLFHDIVVIAKVDSTAEMDRHTRDWRQFLSVEEPED